ncbi:MAG: hypothetical protein ACM3ZB_01710 [bacterium]
MPELIETRAPDIGFDSKLPQFFGEQLGKQLGRATRQQGNPERWTF